MLPEISMKIKFNTFYTDDIPSYVPDLHKRVCDAFGFETNYHVEKKKPKDPSSGYLYPGYREHGEFMDHVLNNSEDDIVAFLDVDCLPINKYDIEDTFKLVEECKTFAGNAQNISHQSNRNFIYAAASFLVIHKQMWELLGKPSMVYEENEDGILVDTAARLTARANQVGANYQLYLPCGYSEKFDDTVRLGPYGFYGRGTTYYNTWHLFRVSEIENNENMKSLWLNTAYDILEGKGQAPNYKFYPYRVLGYF